MYHPTTFEDLRKRTDTERDALIAAAFLPNLPGDEVLVRVDGSRFDPSDDLETFEERVSTIAGSENLRRVEPDEPPGYASHKEQVVLKPRPHGIGRTYRVGTNEVDLIAPTDSEYDFDDTAQSFLSDFGVGTRATDAVHLGVRRSDDDFARKPVFPA